MIIDVHHHWMPREHVENLRKYLRPGEVLERKGDVLHISHKGRVLFSPCSLYYDMEKQIKDMDEAGIDMAVLGISCWQEWNSMAMAPFINDSMAEVQAKYPERFIGLAHVPPFEEGALEELERAIKVLKLRGVCITTNTKGKYPDAAEFRPFFKKVAELDVPVVVHAATAPYGEEIKRIVWDGIERPILGRALDHSLAVIRTLFSHLLKELPSLKFVHGHLGGALYFTDKDRQGLNSPVYQKYMSQLYFDTAPVGWSKSSIAFAIKSHGVEHVMMGSDYPVHAVAGDSSKLKRGVLNIEELDLTKDEKKLILGGNAARVFKVKGS